MLSPLRRELQQLLAQTPASRKIALRRSDAPDALLATDLPLVAEEDDLAAFIAVAMARGWRVSFLPNGWLALDHDVAVPNMPVPVMPEGEMGCCLSLLARHPQHPQGEADAVYIRALVKADDAGLQELEKLCRGWHRDFARRLRLHQPLPDVLPHLCAAIHHHTAKEATL